MRPKGSQGGVGLGGSPGGQGWEGPQNKGHAAWLRPPAPQVHLWGGAQGLAPRTEVCSPSGGL